MKKKIAILLSTIVILTIIGIFIYGTYTSSETYRKKEAANYKGMAICIDDTVYINTGVEIPVEPDECDIEVEDVYELYGATDSIIEKFARIHEDDEDYLVCLIDGEWFKFIEE